MSKALFTLAVLLMVTVRANSNPLQNKSAPKEVIILEEGCVRQGGMCQRIEDCDPNNLVQIRGILCAGQQNQEVECCYL